MSHPEWFRSIIVQGLQMLIALRLRGAPAADTTRALANLWIATIASRPIAWDEQLDRERIQAAFRHLAATCHDWPAPAALLEAMPARKPQPMLNAPVSKNIPPKVRAWIDQFLGKSKSA